MFVATLLRPCAGSLTISHAPVAADLTTLKMGPSGLSWFNRRASTLAASSNAFSAASMRAIACSGVSPGGTPTIDVSVGTVIVLLGSPMVMVSGFGVIPEMSKSLICASFAKRISRSAADSRVGSKGFSTVTGFCPPASAIVRSRHSRHSFSSGVSRTPITLKGSSLKGPLPPSAPVVTPSENGSVPLNFKDSAAASRSSLARRSASGSS